MTTSGVFRNYFTLRARRAALAGVLVGSVSLTCTSAFAQIQFSDVSAAAGLTHVGETYGASWGDVNGDGFLDIFASNHRDQPALYLNTGMGTFLPIQAQTATWVNRPSSDTHGGSFSDFDNDGDQDLFVTIGRNPNGTLQQFLVNERGALINKTAEYQVIADNWGGRTPIWFDGNFDGKMDFMMAMFGNVGQIMQQGSGAFTNVTSPKKLKCQKYHYGQLFDVNNDGRMDLLCSGETYFPQKAYDTLPQPYADITAQMPSITKVTDTAIGDFNNDLRQDIFYTRGANRVSSAELYGEYVVEALLLGGKKGFNFVTTGKLNVDLDWNLAEANKGFPRIKIGSAGIQPAASIFTLDPADPTVLGQPVSSLDEYPVIHIWFDPAASKWFFQQLSNTGVTASIDTFSDGYYVVTSDAKISKLKTTGLWVTDKPIASSLVMNYASGYVEDSVALGVSAPVQCISVVAGDFDNDMDLDLYLACRNGTSNLENVLYVNQGNGQFVKQVGAGGAAGPVGTAISGKAGTADSVIVGDYDVDGFLDLFVVNGFNMRPVGAGGPDKLFRNNGNGNHWIELDLVGTGASTRDATNAIVYATANGVTQMRVQNNGFHRWSQNDRRIHFGLAGVAKVDLTIVWPTGVTETFSNVDADQLYRVTQGVGLAARAPGNALPYPCGVPSYDGAVDNGIVMWKDCAKGTWKLRMVGGNASDARFAGSVSSTAPFVTVAGANLESPPDVLTQTASLVTFDFRTSGRAEDALNIDLAPGAGSCFAVDLPPGGQVRYGLMKAVVTPPFDLDTLAPCVPATATLGIDDVVVGEADGTATLTVSLNGPSTSIVTVDVASQDGTATVGRDYTALPLATLTFNPGETSKTVTVSILDDTAPEGDETVIVNLSNATNASLTKMSGTVTIADNEIATCGAPTYNPGTDKAIFIWQDCAAGTWSFRMSPGGSSTIYTGALNSDLPFASVTKFSVESVDTFTTSTPGEVSYVLKTSGAYHDGFSVKFADGARSCFVPTSPAVPVYIGAAKTPISTPVDLTTMGDCVAP